jgi:hypothetical protein
MKPNRKNLRKKLHPGKEFFSISSRGIWIFSPIFDEEGKGCLFRPNSGGCGEKGFSESYCGSERGFSSSSGKKEGAGGRISSARIKVKNFPSQSKTLTYSGLHPMAAWITFDFVSNNSGIFVLTPLLQK